MIGGLTGVLADHERTQRSRWKKQPENSATSTVSCRPHSSNSGAPTVYPRSVNSPQGWPTRFAILWVPSKVQYRFYAGRSCQQRPGMNLATWRKRKSTG